MAQRRKVEVGEGGGDDKGKELSSLYRDAANRITQLYQQGLNQQRSSFLAGEQHALAKLNHWVQVKLQEGKPVTASAITAYLQEEMNYSLPSPQVWGTGSCQSSSSQKKKTEADVSSSSAPVPAQCNDGNTHGSEDAEMEISSENTSH